VDLDTIINTVAGNMDDEDIAAVLKRFSTCAVVD
jgi:hypothetical protein